MIRIKLKFLILIIYMCALLQSTHSVATDFSNYKTTGSDILSEKLSRQHDLCDIGKNQSPINLEPGFVDKKTLVNLKYTHLAKTVINKGTVIEFISEPGNELWIGNRVYTLKSAHLHLPAEHMIEGRTYDLEIQFIHQDNNQNTLIVAVLFSVGNSHSELGRVGVYVPKKRGESKELSPGLNLSKLVPKLNSFYLYNGSLTFQPCSEGVLWIVAAQVLTLSKEQLKTFDNLISDGSRAIQPKNARLILKK